MVSVRIPIWRALVRLTGRGALKLLLIWSYNKWEKVTIYFSEAPKRGRYKVSQVKARSSRSPSCTGVNFKQMGWISCHRPAQLVSRPSCNSLRNMQMWIAFSRRLPCRCSCGASSALSAPPVTPSFPILAFLCHLDPADQLPLTSSSQVTVMPPAGQPLPIRSVTILPPWPRARLR